MSQRPRLAGDGKLELPAKVAFDHHGFVRGRFSGRTVDPFDWTEDRLLLAESFARLDLEDRQAVKAWWVTHGAVNRLDFTGGDAALPDEHDDWLEHRSPTAFIESRQENAEEQANLAWHLATLVRLSDHREDRRWDPAWGEFVLDGPNAYLMGGPHSGTKLWPSHRFDLARQFPASFDSADLDQQVALLPEVARRPKVFVRASAWYGYLGDITSDGAEIELDAEVFRALGSTWDSALELERLLMEPYVARAVERTFRIDSRRRETDGHTVLVPREGRVWASILAPIYLQLFEALRRISEGEPGAATCRECVRSFLVLDARRRFFCNDRERFRFSQRERRRRLAAEPTLENPA